MEGEQMETKVSMETIRRAYGLGEGRHWFDADTMRFFACRLPTYGYRAAHGDTFYFVSSEQGPTRGRRYSVREMTRTESGEYDIDTRGGFQAYATRAAADRVARAYAATSGAPVTYLHGADAPQAVRP